MATPILTSLLWAQIAAQVATFGYSQVRQPEPPQAPYTVGVNTKYVWCLTPCPSDHQREHQRIDTADGFTETTITTGQSGKRTVIHRVIYSTDPASRAISISTSSTSTGNHITEETILTNVPRTLKFEKDESANNNGVLSIPTAFINPPQNSIPPRWPAAFIAFVPLTVGALVAFYYGYMAASRISGKELWGLWQPEIKTQDLITMPEEKLIAELLDAIKKHYKQPLNICLPKFFRDIQQEIRDLETCLEDRKSLSVIGAPIEGEEILQRALFVQQQVQRYIARAING